jgi:hypothetical protein
VSIAEAVSLVKHIGNESLWGRRGLLKINSLWLSLVVFIWESQRKGVPALAPLLLFLLSVVCWILVSILSNDLSDFVQDRLVGKPRWICRVPRAAAGAGILIVIGAGSWALIKAGGARSAIWVYLAALVSGLGYSLRPLRLKEKGAWGIFAYSLSSALAYAVLPGVWLEANWRAIVVLTQAVFLDKWVNLHFHQIVDYPSDFAGGTRTYTGRAGLQEAGQTLQISAHLAAVGILAALGYSLWLLPHWRLPVAVGTIGAIAAASVYIAQSRKRPLRRTDLVRWLPKPYLVLTLVVFRILPIIFLAQLALESIALRVVFAVGVILVSVEMAQLRRYRNV